MSIYHALRECQGNSPDLFHRSLITRSWRTGLLYGMTCLMREILFPVDTSRMVRTARFVCRLCDIDLSSDDRSPFDNLLLVRALLWAGFVFISPVDHEGMNPGYSLSSIGSE